MSTQTSTPPRMSLDGRHSERGMVAVWTAVGMVAFIVIIGIGVDFAGHARTTQDAQAVAQAARAGGQHLELTSARARPDIHQALAAANNYIASSEFTGSSRIQGGSTVHVQVAGTYRSQFLTIIGINSLPVSASGAATVVTTIQGSEE